MFVSNQRATSEKMCVVTSELCSGLDTATNQLDNLIMLCNISCVFDLRNN